MVRTLLLTFPVHLVLRLLLFLQLLLHRLLLLLLEFDRRWIFFVLGMSALSTRAQTPAAEAKNKNGGRYLHDIWHNETNTILP
jgi:hypothetical protein